MSQATQTDINDVKLFEDAECQTSCPTIEVGEQCNLPILTYDDIRNNDSSIMFYTGIPDKTHYEALFDEILKDAYQNIIETKEKHNEHSDDENDTNKGGRPRSLR